MFNKKGYIIITILLLLLTMIPSIESIYSTPQAGWFCSSMGSNMDRNSISKTTSKGLLKADEPNRKWTVEEIFNKSVMFTSYYGEGEGDWIFANKVDRGANRAGSSWSDSTVQDNLKAARSMSCVIGKGDLFPNIGLGVANSIVGLISHSITILVGNDFMVDGLVEIIGGTGGDEGLISIFLHSIYTPLVVIALLITAVTIVYKGLIQMKLREAFSSIIWSVAAFVIGVTLMLIPNLLVGTPQAITSTITTCVLGALNGQNCLTGEVTTPSLLTGIECASRVEGDLNSADMMVNGMNCTIWKTFVLEPWAEEQFGTSYNNLYTYNPPSGADTWEGLEGDGKQYCVNLASSQSGESSVGPVVMDRNDDATVCNIALYQLYLMTEMEDPVNHYGDGYVLTSDPNNSDAPYDERWFDIIVPMAKHSSAWRNWSGQARLLGRLGSANMSLFAVSAAALVLVVLSVFGAAYKLISVIMMAFAPLFFLFAVEPTRGKRIFLGWLETLISSLLKYFAITLLIIVSLILYAGILSTTTGVSSFIAVIVLTAALLMYREEVVNLIGASNMGGQRLSNRANKTLDWAKKQGKEKGSAIVGGAIGGVVGSEMSRRGDIKQREQTVSELQNQLSRATKENRTEDVKIIQEAINENQESIDKFKGLEGIKNKTASRLEGAGIGASDSLGRVVRRGTSMSATMFKQKGMTQKELDKRYADQRGKISGNMKEAEEALERERMNNNSSNEDNSEKFEYDNLDLSNINMASQRDQLQYTGNLTEEEKSALNKFADTLTSIEDENELSTLANDKEILLDENKKNIVANELNARIRFNTLQQNVGNPALLMNPLANVANMSSAEVQFLMNTHRENYLNTGDEAELDKYKNYIQEALDRELISEEIANNDIEDTILTKETLGDNTFEGNTTLGKEELQEMYNRNPEEYAKYMENYKSDGEKVGISQELLKREHNITNDKEKAHNKEKTNDKEKDKPAQVNYDEVNNESEVNKNSSKKENFERNNIQRDLVGKITKESNDNLLPPLDENVEITNNSEEIHDIEKNNEQFNTKITNPIDKQFDETNTSQVKIKENIIDNKLKESAEIITDKELVQSLHNYTQNSQATEDNQINQNTKEITNNNKNLDSQVLNNNKETDNQKEINQLENSNIESNNKQQTANIKNTNESEVVTPGKGMEGNKITRHNKINTNENNSSKEFIAPEEKTQATPERTKTINKEEKIVDDKIIKNKDETNNQSKIIANKESEETNTHKTVKNEEPQREVSSPGERSVIEKSNTQSISKEKLEQKVTQDKDNVRVEEKEHSSLKDINKLEIKDIETPNWEEEFDLNELNKDLQEARDEVAVDVDDFYDNFDDYLK